MAKEYETYDIMGPDPDCNKDNCKCTGIFNCCGRNKPHCFFHENDCHLECGGK